MKQRLAFSLLITAFAGNFTVFGQSESFKDSAYYVVIGAFRVENHAKTWVRKAKESKFQPVSALNKNRNLYYVYVMRTEDRVGAIEEALKLRKDTTYWDTWVYKGTQGTDVAGNTHLDIHALSSLTASPATGSGSSGGTDRSLVKAENVLERGKVDSARAVAKADSIAAAKPGVAENTTAPEPGAKLFKFTIKAAETQADLAGKIDVIDLDKARKSGTYQGNKTVYVNPPNKSGNVSLVCQLFGYRRYERPLNFFTPSDSGSVTITPELVTVPFELMRLQKGDFAVMYNVYFFKDAAIMRPESKYEVGSLLAMMKENPKYKIKIHGHTNGGGTDKIISVGDTKNFFSLNDARHGFGTAKKLSEERARMMRAYLVNEGIDMKRMEIKAWGGKKPVYDKMSPQAQANVRVEIEILEDK